MSVEPAIEARGLGFSYVDGTQALIDVSLSIPRGKKITFLGPNGSGKTTLFLHFNGLIKPDRGKVLVDGREIIYKHANLLEVRKKVGIIFQDPETQLFSSSVRQEISFGPINLGLSRQEVERRVNQAMADTGITDLKDKPTHFLSYGQKKRVSIADILAMQPSVLICDEPTAWLDKKHEGQIMRLLSEINSQGVTVIMSTHDVDLAYSWSDYIFVMNKGMIVGEGPPEKIFYDFGLLAEAELERPWLLDIYDDLGDRGFLRCDHPPRTKDELCKNMAGLRAAAHSRIGIHGGGRAAGGAGRADAGYRLHDGKMLRRGFTTGACAAAAARAAVLTLLGQAPAEAPVQLPGGGAGSAPPGCRVPGARRAPSGRGGGGSVVLPVAGAERDGDSARAWVIKDAGDDPDVTNGAVIEATVRLCLEGVVIRGGRGVGTVTRPGLAVPPGQPAINPVPLQMIRDSVAAVLPPGSGAEVIISVPEGERLARQTMNPQLGIVGGISILGTTGIVEPMSEEAFKQALTPQLDVARATGQQTLVLTPGRRGVSLAAEFGVPPEAVILISNFIGFMLEECVRRGFSRVLLWGHVGKLAKVAAGAFQTYNRIADGRAEAVAALAAAGGAGSELVRAILDAPTAEAMVGLLREAGLERVWHDVAGRASSRAAAYARNGLQVGTMLFSYGGTPVGWDDNAVLFMTEAGWTPPCRPAAGDPDRGTGP